MNASSKNLVNLASNSFETESISYLVPEIRCGSKVRVIEIHPVESSKIFPVVEQKAKPVDSFNINAHTLSFFLCIFVRDKTKAPSLSIVGRKERRSSQSIATFVFYSLTYTHVKEDFFLPRRGHTVKYNLNLLGERKKGTKMPREIVNILVSFLHKIHLNN